MGGHHGSPPRERRKKKSSSSSPRASGLRQSYIRHLCWLVSGGDALRYEQLLLGTDVCTVFGAFISWATHHGHAIITLPERARRLSAARSLMRTQADPL